MHYSLVKNFTVKYCFVDLFVFYSCIILCVDNALYNLEPGSLKCKRRIAFNSMSHLSLSTLPDNFFVVHVPAEYDYVLISQDKVELITRLMEAFEEAIESSLRINFENK